MCVRLTVALVMTAAAGAAADPPAPRPSLIDLPAALARAASVTPETHPDADDVNIDGVSRVVYAPDGTSVETMDFVFKVLTEKGRRDASTFALGYSENYGTAEVLGVEIHREGEPPRSVNLSEQLRVMIDPEQMQDNIYDPKSKVLQAGIPGLRIHDIVRIRTRMTYTRTRVPNQFFDRITLEGGSPILRMAYEVHAPKALPLRWMRVRNEQPGTIEYTRREEAEFTVHQWVARDVPRMFPEPGMPAPYTVAQRVLVSTAESWEDISRWYWNLARPRMEALSPEIRAAVEDITRDCETPMQRVEALFRFVSREIRYLGVIAEAEAPGYEPHDVSLTFQQRYGVCRDKCALLAAMLRLAGVDAFPVLIMGGPRIDDEVPMPFFNHAITGARIDGKIVLMDPTDENTRELMPSYLDYCSFLAATPEGEPLRVSPVTPSDANRLRINTEGGWSRDGTLEARTRIEFAGVQDTIYRNVFSRMKPDELRRFFEGALYTALPGARMTGFTLTPADMQDRSAPLAALLEFTATEARVEGSHAWTPAWPSFAGFLGAAPMMLNDTGLASRKYPLKIGFTCATEESIRLRVGNAFGPAQAIPAPVSREEPEASFTRTWALDHGTAEVTTSLHLRALEFDPEGYDRLKLVLRDMQRAGRARMLFAPAPGDDEAAEAEANLRVLEHRREYVVEDAHTWTLREHVRKKVLTYAGMKSASEIEVPFNPEWEEVALESASVTDADGRTQEISPREINLMDAAWTGAAPRYPPERVLIASLPGVRVGSEIAWTVVRACRARPFFHALAPLGGFDPVDRAEVRVDAPDTLALRVSGARDARVKFEERADAGRRIMQWTADDLPAIPREPDMPPAWACVPTVFLSSGDWAEYARTARAALERAASGQRSAAREGRRRARAARTFEDRVRAIRDAVVRRIREAGPSMHELPFDAVTPADRTWADGYGNAADIAVLLHAMLSGAGFEPEFVLAGDPLVELELCAPRRDAPDPSLFPRPLVRLRAPDGGWMYLGDSGEYAPPGATPSSGRAMLELSTGTIGRIVVPEDRDNSRNVHYRIALDADGAAHVTVREERRGMWQEEFLRGYRERSPEEQRQYEEQAATELSHAAVMRGGMRVLATPSRVTSEWEADIPAFAAADHGRLALTLPDTRSNILRLRGDTRRNPWMLDERRRERITYEILAPAEFGGLVMSPPDVTWNTHAGRVIFRAEPLARAPAPEDSNRRPLLSVERRFELDPAEFPASDYPRLLDINRELSHPRNQTILLEETDRAAETPAARPDAA